MDQDVRQKYTMNEIVALPTHTFKHLHLEAI